MSMKSFHSRGRRAAPAARPKPEPAAREGLVRADALLVQQGLMPSRTLAQGAIAAGRVRHGKETLSKASQLLRPDARLEVTPDAG